MTKANQDNKSKETYIKSPTEKISFNKLKDHIANRFKQKYFKETNSQHSLNIIEDLIFNKKTHLVALFKDYMIADYVDEFLKRDYNLSECRERLPKFATYYLNYLTFFGLPTFSDSIPNEMIKDYGEKRAEAYYNKNYNQGKESESFSQTEDEDEYNISKSKIMKTIFNSRIKDTIDNVTVFTNKQTESNIVSNVNTFAKRKKKQIIRCLDSQDSQDDDHDDNDDTITLRANGTMVSNDETELISNEASLVSYIRMFNRHQKNKANKMNNRIKVKRLGNYAPPNGLSKRRTTSNVDKESDLGSGTIDNSHNMRNNKSLSKFKGLISATNLFLRNKKQQLSKSPLNHLTSNKSNGSNCSTLKINSNNTLSKENSNVKKNKSRNAKQNDIGFKSDNIHLINDHRLQLTKTQKIDNIISKYTIFNNAKLLSSNLKKKHNIPYAQLKMKLKNHPLVVRQLGQNGYVKSNPNFWKRRNSGQSDHNNNKDQYDPNTKHQKKQSASEIMKIALGLLIDSKKTKSTSNVNININNQININTNYPVKSSIENSHNTHTNNPNKGIKSDTVALNIKSNLTNLLKANKYSRNKANLNGLGSNTEDDGGTLASSGKGKIYTTWGIDEKKHLLQFKTKNPQIKFTSNNFNRPPSNDYSLKQGKRQQLQIKAYISKDNTSKNKPKASSSSSNCFLQTLSKPLVVSGNTKSTSSFKTQKGIK